MKPIRNYAIITALLAKLLAIIVFIALYASVPINYSFTLYNNVNFNGTRSIKLPPWIVHFANFDGYHYLTIAKDGYTRGQTPFFPLYPMAIQMLRKTTNLPYVAASQLISLAAFAGAIYFCLKLLDKDKLGHMKNLFLLILLLYPTSYSYNASYNDSLFFLLATGCIYYSRNKTWIPAALLGMLATMTRLNGLALIPFMVIEYFSTNSLPALWQLHTYKTAIQTIRKNSSQLAPLLWTLLIPIGLGIYLVYLQQTFGDWHIMSKSMHVWGQDRMVFPLQTMWRYIKIFTTIPTHTIIFWIAFLELSSVICYLAVLFASWKRIRPSYWIFIAASILIPSVTGTFQGMPRYGLHLYPLFLYLTLHISQVKPYMRVLYLAISFILYVCCITLFTHGYFIA